MNTALFMKIFLWKKSHPSSVVIAKTLRAYTSGMMKMFYFFMDEGRKIIKIHTVILTGKKAYFEFFLVIKFV